MLGFLTRNERPALARARRRARSARASVFLEFALILPLVVLLVSAMIEFAGFWDSKIMANHAAWTVGRIAMVHGEEGMKFNAMPSRLKSALTPWNGSGVKIDKFNDRGVVATTLLMMTCEMGYFGKTTDKSFAGFFETMFVRPLDDFFARIPGLLTDTITTLIRDAADGIFGSFKVPFLDEQVKKLKEKLLSVILEKPIALLTKQLTALCTTINNAVRKLTGLSLKVAEDDWQHLGREFAGALRRVSEVDKVVTVGPASTQPKNNPYRFDLDNPLSYPQICDEHADRNTDKTVKRPSVSQTELLHVRVSWPYARGWLFPAVSGKRSVKDYAKKDYVRAVGHSLVLPAPEIINDNLKSKGATAFVDPTFMKDTNVTSEVSENMTRFMKQLRYIFQYRIRKETLQLSDNRVYFGYLFPPSQPLVQPWGEIFNVHEGHFFSFDRGSELYRVNWDSLRETTHERAWDAVRNGTYHIVEHLRWPVPDGTKGTLAHRYWGGHSDYGHYCEFYQPAEMEKTYNLDRVMFSLLHKGMGECARDGSDCWKHYSDLQKHLPICARSCVIAKRGLEGGAEYDAILKEIKKLSEYNSNAYATICRLVEDEIKELDKLIKGEGDDFGDDEVPEEAQDGMDDPAETAKKGKEAWEKLHTKIIEKWLELNQKIGDLDTARDRMFDVVLKSSIGRFEEARLQLRHGIHAASGTPVEGLGREGLVRYLMDTKAVTVDVYGEMQKLKAEGLNVQKELDACFALEKELGSLLALKSAKKAKPWDPNTIDPGSAGDVKKYKPPKSSPESGSDDDEQGDRWKLKDGVWKKAN